MTRTLCVAGLIISVANAGALARQADFINLGPGTRASGVSASGDLVVGVGPLTGGNNVFRWTVTSGFQYVGLGSVTSPGVSADGATVGWSDGNTLLRWNAGSGTQSAVGGQFQGISGDGSTLVGASIAAQRGYRWVPGSAPVALQPPPGTGEFRNTYAYDVSFNGSVVVGGYSPMTGGAVPLRWDAAGVSAPLGQIPGYGVDGVANVVTPDGNMVFGYSPGQGGFDTFRWTAATGMVGLGVAQGGFVFPLPADSTPDGKILVGTTFGEAFVWRLGTQPRSVRSILQDDFGINVEFYTIDGATGISDDGRTVVGWGTDIGTGERFGWVVQLPWSIPSPSVGAVLIAGLVAGAHRRRG